MLSKNRWPNAKQFGQYWKYSKGQHSTSLRPTIKIKKSLTIFSTYSNSINTRQCVCHKNSMLKCSENFLVGSSFLPTSRVVKIVQVSHQYTGVGVAHAQNNIVVKIIPGDVTGMVNRRGNLPESVKCIRNKTKFLQNQACALSTAITEMLEPCWKLKIWFAGCPLLYDEWIVPSVSVNKYRFGISSKTKISIQYIDILLWTIISMSRGKISK